MEDAPAEPLLDHAVDLVGDVGHRTDRGVQLSRIEEITQEPVTKRHQDAAVLALMGAQVPEQPVIGVQGHELEEFWRRRDFHVRNRRDGHYPCPVLDAHDADEETRGSEWEGERALVVDFEFLDGLREKLSDTITERLEQILRLLLLELEREPVIDLKECCFRDAADRSRGTPTRCHDQVESVLLGSSRRTLRVPLRLLLLRGFAHGAVVAASELEPGIPSVRLGVGLHDYVGIGRLEEPEPPLALPPFAIRGLRSFHQESVPA